MSGDSPMLRVCPMRDAICPYGMACRFTDGYNCKPGWDSPVAFTETMQPDMYTGGNFNGVVEGEKT